MKESAKILTVIMVIFFGFATIASNSRDDNHRVQVIPGENGIFKFVYLESFTEPIQISILNKDGSLLDSEIIESNKGFIRDYDLSEHGSGEYVFRAEGGDSLIDYKIFYESETGLALHKMGKCEKYKLSVERPTSTLLVSIYNFDGKLIDQDRITNSESFSRVYDLADNDNLTSGLSFVVVDDNGLLKKATF